MSSCTQPWRPAYIPQNPALYILELSKERISDFKIGDRLKLETNPDEVLSCETG